MNCPICRRGVDVIVAGDKDAASAVWFIAEHEDPGGGETCPASGCEYNPETQDLA